MKHSTRLDALLACAALAWGCGGGGPAPAGGGTLQPIPHAPARFVNWENAPVHPVALTPDGSTLLVCNTADGRLEIFDASGAAPVIAGSVFVGLEPVSVRPRGADAWVVNHVSDSVSVVDVAGRRVRATLATRDEPCDVVFAGAPERAYVSCSQADVVLVFDPEDLAAPPLEIPVDAEDPRALAASADGSEVYVAIFESGNGSTLLGGGGDEGSAAGAGAFPPNVVSDPEGPHGGVNPPPNDGASFSPAQNPLNPAPPPVGLIVKKDGAGAWRDDTGVDWTEFVSGAKAPRSGRPAGWDLPDRDVAVIDTATQSVARYLTGLMNVCMDVAVRPSDGSVTVVGTDAVNEVRYEPNVRGRFLRVLVASVAPGGGSQRHDLNAHLDYSASTLPQPSRDLSLGDPRAVAWNSAGTRAFVTGMGSDNLVALDAFFRRIGRVELGSGPTGIAFDGARDRLYVLNRFSASVSVVDATALQELSRTPFFDPTPEAIREGRPHLYDTHETSGLGQAACASCHVDARMDRLAWDLGDPAGAMGAMDQNCVTGILVPCEEFHPMKGPMTTQT
ncbi:MAG: YncE family protein, partial [Planctomycetota bacterium]